MGQNFNIYDFSKDVVYSVRSKEGRKRFIYDDGCAHLTEEQETTIKAMQEDGSWDADTFESALRGANNRFADDVVEGKLDISALPEGEAHLARLLQTIEETGNEELLDSAKDFVRAALSDEVTGAGMHGSLGNGPARFAVQTHASWVDLLPNVHNAIYSALDGRFSSAGERADYGTLDHFIKDRGTYEDRDRALKVAAKALKADMKEHLAATAPEADAEATQKTGLSAAAARAARFEM